MDKRILLVEDEEHLVDVMKLNLELEGYAVKIAEDGVEALDLWQSQRFDLILLDSNCCLKSGEVSIKIFLLLNLIRAEHLVL